jgi:hypothetical protein
MLKHFLLLFIIFFPISLCQNPFSPKSLTTLKKYNDVSIKMDGIVYNLLLNIEDFRLFEDINFKIYIKKNNGIKVQSIQYGFIKNDNFSFDTFNHLNNNIKFSVQYTSSKNYYYYFKVEKEETAKYLLLKLELNSYDPSNELKISNTQKFEGGLSIIYFLIILVIFCLFIAGVCFGIFYTGYLIFKFFFPRLFYIPPPHFENGNNIYSNNYQMNPNNNGYIYPIMPMPNQQNSMPSYYVNYPQPQFSNINQPQIYGMNLEQAPINIHTESSIGDNSDVVVNVPYEKPH